MRKILSARANLRGGIIHVILALLFSGAFAPGAWAAVVQITKTANSTITVPSYASGDTLQIVGAALQTETGDWDALGALTTTPYELVLNDATTEIPARAFEIQQLAVCCRITAITANSVTNVGDRAFYNCLTLTTVSLPAAAAIGDSAFTLCLSLTDMTLPNAPPSVAESAFQYGTSPAVVIWTPSGDASAYSGWNGYFSEGMTVQQIPAVPRNFTATPGDTQVSLTWEAPASEGSSAVTGYNLNCRQNISM
jgi:hypothetical protein